MEKEQIRQNFAVCRCIYALIALTKYPASKIYMYKRVKTKKKNTFTKQNKNVQSVKMHISPHMLNYILYFYVDFLLEICPRDSH